MDLKNQHKINKLLLLCLFSMSPLFQSQAQRIFWTERSNNRVMVSSDIVGITNAIPLTNGLDNVEYLEVDQASGFIVITLNGTERLFRLNIDGSNLVEVRDFGAFTGFNDIEVNQDDGLIYGSEINGGINYYDINGPFTENQMVLTGSPGGANADYSAIAYSSDGNNFYFVNINEGDTYVSDGPTGTSAIGAYQGFQPDLLTIDENNNKLYYVESNSLYRSNLDTGSPELLINIGTQVFDIEIYPNVGLYYCTSLGIFYFDFELESNTLLYSQTDVRGLGIEQDFSRPVVQTYVPTQGQSGVAVGATQLSLRFDENIKTSISGASGSDIEIQLFRDGSLFESISRNSSNLSISGTDLTINLNNALVPGDYHVLIGDNVISNVSNLDYAGISNTSTWNFTVDCTKPTLQVTNLAATVVRETGLTMTFTAGNGNSTIVLAKSGGPVDAIPVDGTNYADNLVFGFGDEIGTGNYVVYKGTTGFTPTSLPDGITHFAAFTFNTAENCYLTTSPATFQGPDFSASIINGSGSTTLSSIASDDLVFRFTLDAPTTDLQFFQLNINAVSGTNEVLWSDIFSAVRLTDDDGNSENGTIFLSQSTVSFNGLALDNIGMVAGGTTKEYALHVSMRSDITSSVASDLDNRLLAFEVTTNSFFVSTSSPSTFLSSAIQSASSGAVTVEVNATEISIAQQPSTNVEQFEVLTQQPIFEATDVNGNRDLDFNESLVVGTGDPDDLLPVSALSTFSAGLANFAGSGFNFEAAGTSTMHILTSPSALLSPNTSSITVDAIPPVLTSADVAIVANTNCVNENGRIEVTNISPGNVGDHTFLLQDDMGVAITGSGPTYSNLLPGDYTISATSNNSGLMSAPLVLTVADNTTLPVVLETITPNGSCTGSNGTITLDVDGGASIANYTFEWFEGSGTSTPLTFGTINANQVQNLPGGTYTARVTNNITGCSTESLLSVSEILTLPLSPSAVPNSGCLGNPLPAFEIDFLTISSEINWYDNDPTSGGNPISNSIDANSKTLPATDFPGGISSTGVFTVFASYVDGLTGCESVAIATTVTITSPATGTLSVFSDFGGFGVSCNGAFDGEIEIIASGGTGPYTFELIETGTMINAASSAVFDNLQAGDYTVIITDANSCVSNSNVATLTEPDAITTTINVTSDYNGSQISCQGVADGQLTVTAANGSAPYTYHIVRLPGNTSGANSGIFDGVPQGNYTVLVTDANTCSVITNSINVSEPQVVAASLSVNQPISCAGNADGQISTSASGGTGSLSFILNEAPSNTTGATSGIFTGLPQGSYTVTVTDQNNCSITTMSLALSDPAAYTAVLSGDALICEGETASLNLNITGGTAPYSVNIENIGTISAGGVTVDVSPTATTIFTLLGVIDANGCTATIASGNATITVDQTPSVSIAGDNQEICDQLTTLSANIPSVGTGSWSLVSGTGVIDDSTNPTTSVSQIDNGTTVLRWTISNGVCDQSESEVTITRLPAPSGTGVISSMDGGSEFCQGAQGVTLNVSGLQDVTAYNWTLLDGSTVTTDVPSITFDLPNDAQNGSVSVIGQNLCGQGTRSQGFNITVISAPEVTINTTSEILLNLETSFSFTPSDAISNILWDFGDGVTSTADNPSHTYTEAGTYLVTITGTSSTGCEVSGEVGITVNPADPISIKNAITPNGDGANDQLTIVNIEFYPNNVVTLFDRWGVEVVSFEGYNNDWDLTVEGDLIPAGNYICVVELPDINEIIKRTITVVRSSN